MMNHLNIPPFKIKMIETITLPPAHVREENLKRAYYNLFLLPAKDVFIDLLTDSGTSAMSDCQWSAMFLGDESYAGAKSFYKLQKVTQDIFGHQYLLPTHQGRGAENIFFSSILKPGQTVLNNTHFDTTRANIEQLGGKAVDLPCQESYDIDTHHPFKGNMDLQGLKEAIAKIGKENIPLVMLTVTNNACGGQPVSLENIKAVKHIVDQYNIPLFFDMCRFAENCYFIKKREQGQKNKTVKEIAREISGLADGCLFSAKKDALTNTGGLITLKAGGELFERISNRLILQEGFKTYGGLTGRDLEAMAVGLEEVIQEDYLTFRTGQVELLSNMLSENGIAVVNPPGGHAVYVDTSRFLPHLAKGQFPGQALCVALYRYFGIRSVELGSVMFPNPPLELLRLAIPRRVYTNDHIRYVGEALCKLHQRKDEIKGIKIAEEPPFLRHFSAKFEEVDHSTHAGIH